MSPRSASRSDEAAAERIADRFHSLAIHLLRRLRREDDTGGLNAPRLSALSVVVFAGAPTLGEMAAAEQVRPPTMTRIVNALEAQALVTREPDPDDRRLTRIRATPKGQALLAAGRARRVESLARRLADLSAEEFATLERAAMLLERVVGEPR